VHVLDRIAAMGHEQVVLCAEQDVGYRAVLAVHSTVLGPAVGGTRLWRYASVDEAIVDALRLSRGMTYKCAAAGLPLGGGKAVILTDGATADRGRLFRAHGRAVHRLGGRFVTAEDVGTTPDDRALVREETPHVAGLALGAGAPSPTTARGVFRAIQASAKHRWGSDDLHGKTVSVQGCGHVGHYLARELRAAGARLVVTDIDRAKVRLVVEETGATAVEPEAIYGVEADIFAPCALGGIINDTTIPQLKVEIVAGAANNQLLEERHGDELEARGLTYAPDYVANAGGVVNVYSELAGWDAERSLRKADDIYNTILGVFEIARQEGIPSYRAADRLAERRLGEVRGMVRTWPQWPNKAMT
jgi:leucine dehydrogenase